LGDTGIIGEFHAEPESGQACDKIIELVRAHPYDVSILAVGPLTNLAMALQRDPDIAFLTHEVVIMGGAFGRAGRRGNVSPVAEANIFNDPHAADIVMSAAWPIKVVGLDVTSLCIFPTSQAARLREAAGEAGKLLWDISRNYEEIYRTYDGVEGFPLHDVTAAACLADPSLFEFKEGSIRVVTDGIAIGQTLQKPDGQSLGPSAWDGLTTQKVAVAADNAGVINLYMRSLTTYADRKISL
jgi:inosine-uridine nucleoside N-ribohydrolase